MSKSYYSEWRIYLPFKYEILYIQQEIVYNREVGELYPKGQYQSGGTETWLVQYL